MSRNRRKIAELNAAIEVAAQRRVEAAWECVSVLCPDLTPLLKKELAGKVLDLCEEKSQVPQKPPIQITPAQVQEIVWRNSQCANRYCSMVLFSREIAEELNEFFKGKE
jgi:hypothetical protein